MKPRQLRLIWSLLALSGLGLFLCSILLPPKAFPWAVAAFLGICLGSQVALYRWIQRQFRRLMEQLTALLEQLAQPGTSPVFPPLEDTLLSRLQSQAERLCAVWARQNQQIGRDRDAIQSLISDLSHQLKTPAATLRIYAELLAEDDLDAQARQVYRQRMELALSRLEFLLEGMVKLSRLETGCMQLHPSPTDAQTLLLGAAASIRIAAERKGISVGLAPVAAATICCDSKWILEAIFNVLDNAIKYTPCGGSVYISTEMLETVLRIDIADTGTGIPEAALSKIFQRFYRGENASTCEGVGLGLALTRQILEAQGGWIFARSEGRGSVFSLFLPLV